MKKFFNVVVAVFAVMLVFSLAGCGKKPLTIWVGTESVDFYQSYCNKYIENYNNTHDKSFPTTIEVKGVDSGAAAQTYLNDTEAGPDIFTIPHDNLGKLTAGSSSIIPVTSKELLSQIDNDNSQTFIDVTKSTVDGVTYQFGVPYIAQSLVLYYNKKYLTETDVQTWEAIALKAIAASVVLGHSVKSSCILGTDGYNNSFQLLAQYYSGDGKLNTSLKLYPNGTLDCYGTGDDTISAMKWARRFFQASAGGIDQAGSSGWEQELKDEYSLCLIGGAWNFNAASSALGSNLGIAVLPTFTLTAADTYGSMQEGTVYQSGTFADCKCFVMKKDSKYADYLEDILLYLSSKEVQEKSFEECANLPTYKNASTEFTAMSADTLSAKLASCQFKMFEFGVAQPFGYVTKYNTWYYSKGAPDIIYSMLKNTDNKYPDDASVLACMQKCVKIWTTGSQE